MRRMPLRVVGVVAAVVWWVVGALPWVLGAVGWGNAGMRLPVQNLWRSQTPAEAMPVVALPFSQYSVQQLLAMTIVGGILAVLAALLGRRERRGAAVAVALGGGLVAATAGIGQTAVVAYQGLEPSSAATLYLATMVGVCVVGTVVGLVSGALLLMGPAVLRGAAAAFGAVALGPWLGGLVLRDPITPGQTGAWLLQHIPWVTGLVLGIGLALTGLRPASRLIGWVLALAVAWVAPAAITALSYVGGSVRVLYRQGLAEMLDAGRDVFVAALAPGNRYLPPLAPALVVGVLGSLLGPVIGGRRAQRAPRGDRPDPVPLAP